MARSSVNEPLEKFRFIVEWTAEEAQQGQEAVLVRAGFTDAQTPKRATNKGTYREGTDRDINQLFAGLSSMEDVVFSRGLLPDAGTGVGSTFYQWMSSVHTPSSGNPSSTNNVRPANAASHKYRKDITIKMLDREGKIARVWKLYEAWPVNFVPGSDLNASEDGEKSLEQLTLAYEDFQEVKPTDTSTQVLTTTSVT